MLFTGTKAYDRIMQFIPDEQFKHVDEIVTRIEDFYEETFKLYIDERFKTSQYKIDIIDNEDGTSAFDAWIRLKSSTSRTKEALVHELLHINMALDGYPVASKYAYKLNEKQHEAVGKLKNVIDHLIMIKTYTEMGLEKSKFMVNSLEDWTNVKESDINWWLLNYFIKYASKPCLSDSEQIKTEKWLVDFIELATKVHPGFSKAIQPIHEWFDKYSELNQSNYFQAVNEALTLVMLPPILGYITIQDNEVLEKEIQPVPVRSEP